MDGNHLGATEHRIEELRTTWAAPSPGRALVVLDPRWMLATHAFLTPDGHASERTLLDEVLEVVEARDVRIADRNFCTLGFPFGIARRRGFFVIRQHGCLKGTLLGERRRCGRTSTGVAFEQAIQLTNSETGEGKTWWRITVELKTPTRDGDRELHIRTNLPADEIAATTACELYRKRWTLETVFQEITTPLNCEVPSLGYPPAALVAFYLALVAYNAVSVLKATLRKTHGATTVTPEVSGYFIALEVRPTYDGMSVVIAEDEWQVFGTATAEAMARWLRSVAAGIDLRRYRKHPRGPKRPPPKKSKYKNGGHASPEKLLRERRTRSG